MDVRISDSWKRMLQNEFEKGYFIDLIGRVGAEYENLIVYPPQELIFNAFEHCHFEDVKVVILGQDPYHGEGQAHGLAFSVPDGIKKPPSLQNIYKELYSTIDRTIPESGNLERWAAQGVLLLNTTLTVEAGKAGSHRGLGWEQFTDAVIQAISDKKEHVVFMLWGNDAKQKGKNIDTAKHLILTAPHPSPLSAHTGFFGCKHFSRANEYLKEHGKKPIVW